jgi:hypothetical protein
MIAVIFILLIGVLFEVQFAVNAKNPPALYWWRGLVGIATMVVFHTVNFWKWYDYINLVCFAFGFYWTFFDGLYNLQRGMSWFYIGNTKQWDKFWRSHTALAWLAFMIKWILVFSCIPLLRYVSI